MIELPADRIILRPADIENRQENTVDNYIWCHK